MEDALPAGLAPGQIVLRNEHAEVSADNFGAGIAVDALRGRIPVHDVPTGIDAHHRLACGFDDAGEAFDRLLGLAALRYVAATTDDPVAGPVLIEERGHGHGHPARLFDHQRLFVLDAAAAGNDCRIPVERVLQHRPTEDLSTRLPATRAGSSPVIRENARLIKATRSTRPAPSPSTSRTKSPSEVPSTIAR